MNRRSRTKPSGTTRSYNNLSGVLGKSGKSSRTVSRSASTGKFVLRSGSGEIVVRRVGNEIVSPAGPAKERSQPPERPSGISAEDQVQAEAAKLRQITDRKLGKTTPAWVPRIAGRRA